MGVKFRRSILCDVWLAPATAVPTSTAPLTALFDIYFLRQERTYTKLKYSRVPQYDMVSGGSAAVLAGFLGFLICEKFGFELLDSGDFYMLFMYIVLACFAIRLLLKLQTVTSATHSSYHIYWGYRYSQQLVIMGRYYLRRIILVGRTWWMGY